MLNLITYDSNNIFARILRGEIPCQKVYQNDHVLAFHDIQPQAPVHVLVIPKGAYTCLSHFTQTATTATISGFFAGVEEVVRLLDLAQDGYRIISNNGKNGGQEVPHFHIHILGGCGLGALVAT